MSEKGDKGDKGDKDGKDGAEKATTTTIGPTIVIRGRLKSDEDLIVKGRIDAEISSTKAVQIEQSGIVKANLEVKSAKISGVVVGNIKAESRIEIASDGRMVGDILAPRIVISDGAAFKGRIDMQSFEARKGRETPKRPSGNTIPPPMGQPQPQKKEPPPAPQPASAGPHAPAAAKGGGH